MADVLDRIVARTREDLASRDRSRDDAIEKKARARAEASEAHRFRDAIGSEGVRIIAEIKAASPSAGTIHDSPPVERIAAEYADGGAAAISIVTERHFFSGSTEWIDTARDASGLPVIMKDFVVDPIQPYIAVAAGADALLLLASVLETDQIREFLEQLDSLGRDALVEVHDERELEKAVEAGASIIGVNNRDLRSFDVDLATAERLSRLMPPDTLMVSESGIRSRNDIERLQASGYGAFLIGETLMRAEDRIAMLRELRGAV